GGSKPGGWGILLMQEYSRKMQVTIRGFASYNSYWLKFALEPLLLTSTTGLPERIKLITLLLGTNDYVHPTFNKHVPIDKYTTNMSEMIATILRIAPDAKLLLLTPPPMSVKVVYDGDQVPSNPKIYATLENAKRYRDACLSLVKEFNSIDDSGESSRLRVDVLDTWQLFLNPSEIEDIDSWDPATRLKHLFADTRHFNEDGNRILFEGVVGKIKDTWPELQASVQKEVLPTNWSVAPCAVSPNDDGVRKWLYSN
ncbi:SGNH hydrolase-type esterase domain-containing protein, partial [Obelidium mucronatum]